MEDGKLWLSQLGRNLAKIGQCRDIHRSLKVEAQLENSGEPE